MKELSIALVKLSGGLGMFLLGMKHLSEGLQAVFGPVLRMTAPSGNRGTAAGIGSGLASAAIVQSSAIVTAMLVGFVSTGMMTLSRSVSVIAGANVGTTATVWMLALVPSPWIAGLGGFAAGGALYFFVRRAFWHDAGLAALGFGLAMLGFHFLSAGIGACPLAPASLPAADSFAAVLAAAAVAAAVAAAIRSSATIAIAMLLSAHGVLPVETAIAALLGANVGTTAAAWFAAAGGNSAAKRTALVNTLCNAAGSLALAPFAAPWLVPFFKSLPSGLPPPLAVALSLAAADTAFAVMRGAVALLSAGFLAKLAEKAFPAPPEEKPHLSALNRRAKQSPVIACEQALREVAFMAESDMELFSGILAVLEGRDADGRIAEHIAHRENVLDNVQREVTEFIGDVMSARLAADVAVRARAILRLCDEFESVSDEAPAIVKAARRIAGGGGGLPAGAARDTILSVHGRVQAYGGRVSSALGSPHPESALSGFAAESRALRVMVRDARQSLLAGISSDASAPLRTLAELDILNAYSRARACYTNIAETILGGKESARTVE